MKAAGLGDFSLKTGRLLTRTLGELTGISTKVKEPNDVLALCADGRWRKVAGVLIEASGGSTALDWIAVGIGINLNNEISADLPDASSFSVIAGKRIGIGRIYRQLTSTLRQAWKNL